MKKISAVGLVCILLLFFVQPASSQKELTVRPLQLSYAKTSSIVFPFAIKGVDRGSRDVLLQRAAGVDNVLQLKAAKKSFAETSLTVITADGALYCFDVRYAADPKVLNMSFVGDQHKVVQFSDASTDIGQVRFDSGLIQSEQKGNLKVRDKKFGINMELNGLYVREDMMYFRIRVQNKTLIDYGIDQLRFFIRDSKKVKRTAMQERELRVVHVENKVDKIGGGGYAVMVFAIPKFTIPDKKILSIQLMEENGGRYLELKVRNRHLLKTELVERIYGM